MQKISIEHQASPAKLEILGVDIWPVWRKEVSRFDWHYDREEVCYILDGEAIITTSEGETVTITRGDLVHFPAGMACEWEVTEAMEKHYIFK